MKKVEIAQRRHQPDTNSRVPRLWTIEKVVDKIVSQIRLLNLFQGAWMGRKDNRHMTGDLEKGLEHGRKSLSVVNVGRTMQGQNGVTLHMARLVQLQII